MSEPPLKSLADYSRFVAETLDRPDVQRSTVAVWSDSPYTGTAEGEALFSSGIRLRMRQELDFEAGLITSYGYEVYRGEELKDLQLELWRRLHDPLPDQGKWLRSVLLGHYRHYGVPMNRLALTEFRYQVMRLWKQALKRRSQKSRMR